MPIKPTAGPGARWFTIRAAAAADTTEVMIYGDIGESWWSESVTAAEFVREMQTIDSANLTVRINSFGGSVPDGLAIYNALRRYPGKVTTAIDGVALSIASLIAMAGERVTMAENAMVMVHAPWTGTVGNAVELRAAADLLDRYAAAMASSYSRKTGRSTDEMLALLTDGADHWYGADEAREMGLVDEITDAVEAMASARVDPRRFRSVPAAAAAFLAHKEQSMPIENQAAAQPATPATPAAPTAYVRSAAETAEIRTMFAAFRARDGVQPLLEDVLAEPSVSPDAASKRLLAHIGANVEPARPAGATPRVETLVDEGDKRREAVALALLARSGVRVDASLSANPFRGHRLMDLARDSLARAGVRTDGMTSMEIVAAAFTQNTGDFPILLENAMHKALQAAYATAPDTWSRFCAVGSVSDFRAHPRYRVGSLANLDLVNELAEFRNRTIPDGERSTITATTKGNIINLSRQAVINDDLGAFVGLSGMLGRAARRTIEADVYALLALNSNAGPTMSDGQPMFHSTHANLAGTGAIPSVVTIDAARQAMASQRDVSLNDFLDMRPAVGLFPMAQGGNARVINGAQYDPDTANRLQRPNMVAGLLRDIIDSPRVPGTNWYLFADPAIAPAIEVAFLDGVQEPFLELQNGFDVDGARYKVRLDYGVAGIDWRPAYRNPGA